MKFTTFVKKSQMFYILNDKKKKICNLKATKECLKIFKIQVCAHRIGYFLRNPYAAVLYNFV